MFNLLAIITFFLCLFYSYVFALAAPKCGSLPRWHWPGVVIGLICLVWSARHGCIMLEGSLSRFHPLVWLLVPATTVMAAFFLDYLFARATGGLFILLANELIRCAFIHDVPLRPLYSIFCLLLGICGLYMLGLPWRLRDAIQLAGRNPLFGRAVGCALGLAALFIATLSFFQRA